MDNVSKIAANANFYVQAKAQKEEKKAQKEQDAPQVAGNENVQHKDPNAIFDAMQITAMQNKAVAFGNLINPRDYLSEDRIKDIEASMGVFESNTESVKAQFDSEFQGVSAWESLPEAQKLAMAASTQAI